jgi:KAP family P-loop domain
MHSDAPILSADEDSLGFDSFAERLVRPLVNWPTEDSVVVGLYGAWGTGKSSILNLVVKRIESVPADQAQGIIVRFNPWLYRDTESLILSFFAVLLKALKSKPGLSQSDRTALSNAFSDIVEAIEPVLGEATGLGLSMSLASGAAKLLLKLGKRDVDAKKAKAIEALHRVCRGSVPSRVIILIDDLDRLEADELRTMLRVVKLIADLPHTSYVLAMDQERVSRLLDHADGESGRAYLDKIVQLPVQVPPAAQRTIRALVEKDVLDVLGVDAFALPHGLVSRRAATYLTTIGRRVTTLRDRARLVNNLNFLIATADTSALLHPTDALLISFLQTFYPEVYTRVRQNHDFLTHTRDELAGIMWYATTQTKRLEQQAVKWFKIVTNDSQINSKDSFESFVAADGGREAELITIQNVMQALFPGVNSGDLRKSEEEQEDRRDARICASERFDRYFSLSYAKDEVEDQRVTEAMALVAGDANCKAKRDSAVHTFAYLLRESTVSNSAVEKVSDALAAQATDVLSYFGEVVLDLQGSVKSDVVVELLWATLRSLYAARNASSDAAVSIAINDLALIAASKIVHAYDVVPFAAALTRERHDAFLDDQTRTSVAQAAAARMRTAIANGADIFNDLDASQASRVLWRFRDVLEAAGEGGGTFREFVRRCYDDRLEHIPTVVALAAGWSPAPSLRNPAASEIRASLERAFGFTALHRQVVAFTQHIPALPDPHGLVAQFLEIFPTASSGETSAE